MKLRTVLYTFLFFLIGNLGILCAPQATYAASLSYPQLVLVKNDNSSSVWNKKIVVSLRNQNLTAYSGNSIYLQTPVTTGGPDTPTPLGTFYVITKLRNFTMHSPWPAGDWRWYPDSIVNYGLFYEYGGYLIHDAPWRTNFGPGSNSVLGTPGGDYTGTHGCVNVPLSAEETLYKWASVGTTVIIQP